MAVLVLAKNDPRTIFLCLKWSYPACFGPLDINNFKGRTETGKIIIIKYLAPRTALLFWSGAFESESDNAPARK